MQGAKTTQNHLKSFDQVDNHDYQKNSFASAFINRFRSRIIMMDKSASQMIKSIINILGSFITKLSKTKESVLILLVITLVVMILSAQLIIYQWMGSFDQRVDQFQHTIVHLTEQQIRYFESNNGANILSSYIPCIESSSSSSYKQLT